MTAPSAAPPSSAMAAAPTVHGFSPAILPASDAAPTLVGHEAVLPGLATATPDDEKGTPRG